MFDNPNLQDLLQGSMRPNLEDLEPFLHELNLTKPQELWDLLERLIHEWCRIHSLESDWWS